MDLDVMKWTVANDQIWLDRSDKNFVDYAKSIAKNSTGAIATNLLLYGVLKACGQQRFYWLYFGLFDSISIIFKNSFNGRTCRYANQQYCFN